MMTKKDMNHLKTERESRADRLYELTDEELEQVTGGTFPGLKGFP